MEQDVIDEKVLHHAISQLRRAVTLLESIQHFYMASEADEIRYFKRLAEAVANIHAAEARLK